MFNGFRREWREATAGERYAWAWMALVAVLLALILWRVG